jgi:hypothetical protein
MKELGEKFSVNEFLSYLCPGVCLLLSVALWLKLDLKAAFGEELAGKEGIVVPFFLVVGYALGLMVAAWSGQGAFGYFALRARKPTGWRKLPKLLMWLLHAMPDIRPGAPAFKISLADANLRIAEGLSRYAGFRNLSIIGNPWENVAMYRTLVAGRTGSPGAPIVAEAEAVHTRMSFALNMALVSALIAAEALLRLVLAFVVPCVSIPLLCGLLLAGAVSSWGLRVVAARWRTREVILTGSLAPLIQSPPE